MFLRLGNDFRITQACAAMNYALGVLASLLVAAILVFARITARMTKRVARLEHRTGAVPFTSQSPLQFNAVERSTAEHFDYFGFEEVFRGPEESVRERQRVYTEFFRGRRRVLDLGCGRGEFLEVMREIGVRPSGIDLNAAMVARCKSKGFADVWEADAVQWLANGDATGYDGIFSAQFIEHISFDDLVRLVANSFERLLPGGVFIAETVNPLSIDGLKMFFVDPTHVRPLFPEVLAFLCRSVGFGDVRIFYPNGGGFAEPDPTSQNEYAVVAFKEPMRNVE
jgi:2-polyprenyl-3-methyl-5-hydroxy-6-metoxy-1,4-benzoquinol methylase